MISRLDSTANLALDTQSLEGLRTQARQAPDQALKTAAQQFESVFLNMMLKSMREATPQDGMFDSEQTRMFTGMLDQQLTQTMASRGVGLADIMVKQLSQTKPQESAQKADAPPAGVEPLPGALPSAAADPLSLKNSLPSSSSKQIQQEFLNRMLPHATQASQSGGVPVQLMLGQAALESGWGKREIPMADGSNSHNVFGIKANAGWKGKVAEVVTTEYENGVGHQQRERFRAYSSYAEAFQDYASLIGNNPRYAEVKRQGGDAAGMAQAVQRAGYATDPQYADKLTRVLATANALMGKSA